MSIGLYKIKYYKCKSHKMVSCSPFGFNWC